MIKKILILGLLFHAALAGNAQSAFEALRYSTFNYGGTARSVGTAGVLGAFGGDFSVLSTNPAGLATFRSNELVITPALFNTSVTSDFENSTSTASKTAFHLGNIGIVFSKPSDSGNWKAVNFAIGLNRLNNFHQRFEYDGISSGTIANSFLDYAQGFLPNDLYGFEEGLAYETGLIYRPFDLGLSDDETFYENDFFSGDRVRKKEVVEIRGNMDELVFAGAGNYKHRWYFGAAIGIVFLEYNQVKSYEELDDTENGDDTFAGSVPYFNALKYDQSLLTSGFGTNFKLGVNYRFNQQLRLGAAVHTPTFLGMDDIFSNSLESDITYFELDATTQNERSVLSAESEVGNFAYSLRTPWRFFLNAGLLIGKKGFISAELEYVDYTSPRYRFPDAEAFQEEVRNTILTSFNSSVLNVRLGGEWVLNAFRLRGGVTLNGQQVLNEEGTRTMIHTGLGYRKERFFIDLAYSRSLGEESAYYPYISSDFNQPEVANNSRANNILMTFGFKF